MVFVPVRKVRREGRREEGRQAGNSQVQRAIENLSLVEDDINTWGPSPLSEASQQKFL